MSVSDIPVTQAANLSSPQIAAYAEAVGKRFAIHNEAGKADLERLLKKINGRVEVSKSFSARESSIVGEDGRFTIILPPMTSERRDRFTVAHEIGHYFLHYLLANSSTDEPTPTRKFGRGKRNTAETQANIFAASLLMPVGPFKEAFEESGGDVWKLSQRFHVSPDAAQVRARVLRLME